MLQKHLQKPLLLKALLTYTFNTTVDLSIAQQEYEIEARTLLSEDANTPNDSFTKTISNTTLSVIDQEFNAGDFTIIAAGAKQYDVNFTTTRDFGAICLQCIQHNWTTSF